MRNSFQLPASSFQLHTGDTVRTLSHGPQIVGEPGTWKLEPRSGKLEAGSWKLP